MDHGTDPLTKLSAQGATVNHGDSKDATARSPEQERAGDDERVRDAEGTKRVSSIATVLRQSQGRKRTGSLRKAAMAKMRERSSSMRKERTTARPPIITTTMSADSSDSLRLPTRKLSLSTFTASNGSLDNFERPSPQLFASPIASAGPYASTTDEDDTMSVSSFNLLSQGPPMSLSRRRSNRNEPHTSLTTVQTPADIDLEDEWDYSETEWWGWVVLIVTWIVFVVGMGSCLGVWSWAWDVGETPYAPPELEDDATLPITGYYPALMVCTAVMAWVWVVVAWVGMKYFRHAKVVGEDG